MEQVQVTTKQAKGGSVTKVQSTQRLVLVEKCMLSGLSQTQMVDLKLGTFKTIARDIKKIQSAWLEKDPEWFNRARLARIEAENRLDQQYQRLETYIQNTDLSEKERLMAENLLTNNIDKKEDISSGMDPEEYLNNVIRKKVEQEREKETE